MRYIQLVDFDWDDANLEHIARQGVDDLEAEEALTDESRVRLANTFKRSGETRLAYVGKTEAGRVLTVIVTPRAGKIRVVTARDADDIETRLYRRRQA